MRASSPGEAQQVPLGVPEEGHLLGRSDRAELAHLIDVDDVGLSIDGDPRGPELVRRRRDVVDAEIEDGRWRAGLEEQAGWAEIEEGEPGGIEASDQRELEHVPIEGDSTIEVPDVLGDLVEAVHLHIGIVGRLPI